MPAQTLYIVQQSDKQASRLMNGRHMPLAFAHAAVDRASRDVEGMSGVVAVRGVVGTDTSPVLEVPVVLAAHGRLPREFHSE